jgi:hypothetical protein
LERTREKLRAAQQLARVAVRTLNLYAGIIGTVAWLVLSFGGIGGLIYGGALVDSWIGPDVSWVAVPFWVSSLLLLIIWWGALVAVLLQGRSLPQWVDCVANRKNLTGGEWLIVFGHVGLMSAALNALFFRILSFDFVYGFLLVAGCAFSLGLLIATLTVRSTRTPTGVRQFCRYPSHE